MSAQSEDVALYIVQQQNQMMNVQTLLNLRRRRRRRRARRPRLMWVRNWIGRRDQAGIYNTLLVELENEDPKSFHNFMRMPQDMFKERVARLTPHILKQTTNWRAPLSPGIKVGLTLRHLASGAQYKDMQYAWRIPPNTISLVVTEVCQAIIDEYLDEQMTPPSTEEDWKALSDAR